MTRRASRRALRATSAAVLPLALVLVAAACGGGESRADVVGAMTSEAVPSRFDELAATASRISPAIATWCSSGDPTGAVDAVAATRDGWAELAVFDFGPSMDRRSMFIIDPQPRLVDVDELVASDQPVDADSLRELAGADQRGLGAIDHLLDGEPGERACAYATGAADLVDEEFEALASDWATYGPELAADDDAANDALREIVSEALFTVHMVTEDPDADLAQPMLNGVRWALLGVDGDEEHVGISSLLSEETRQRLDDELAAGDAAELEITITTEVAGELGTTINFSDADGDG